VLLSSHDNRDVIMSLSCDALPVSLAVPLEDGRRRSEDPNKSIKSIIIRPDRRMCISFPRDTDALFE